MTPEAAENNERILAEVEALGGGYVWESEIFAIVLMDIAIADQEAASLCGLIGVEQIALNGSRLAFATLQSIASIPGLQSLVLSGVNLSDDQHSLLKHCGPEIELIGDDT